MIIFRFSKNFFAWITAFNLIFGFQCLFEFDAFAARETLTLQKAIEKAIEKNPGAQIQRMDLRKSEIDYDSAWDKMYLPRVELKIKASSDFTVGDIEKVAEKREPKLHGFPAHGAELTLGEYTVFNFWKDWNKFEKSRISWVRSQQTYTESMRNFRFSISKAYFEAKIAQDNYEYARRFYSLSETILALMRSRERLGKATAEDLTSSQQDMLAKKIELGNSLMAFQSKSFSLNQLLGDSPGTEYLLVSDSEFEPIPLELDQIIAIFRQTSPTMRDLRKDLRGNELDLELAQKERLPLPTVTFSGLGIKYSNEYSELLREINTGSGSTQLNLSASMSLTLTLLGEGGFLNKRPIEKAKIDLDKQLLKFRNTQNKTEVEISNLLREIKQSEQNVRDYKQSLNSSSAILESLMANGATGKSDLRLKFRDALQQMRSDQASLAEANLNYMSSKFDLYELIGVDQLEKEK